jgi:hypothetical protein
MILNSIIIYFHPEYVILYCTSFFVDSGTGTIIPDPGTINSTINISLTTEAGQALASGLRATGSQIGLGTAIGGVAAAASKIIVKSSLPPIQKISLLGAAGFLGAMAHTGAIAANRELTSAPAPAPAPAPVGASAPSTSSNTPLTTPASGTDLEQSVVANSPFDSSFFNLFSLPFDFNNSIDVI